MEYSIFLKVECKNRIVHQLNSTGINRSNAISQYKDAIKDMECFFAINKTLYKLDGNVDICLISVTNWPSFNILSIKGYIKPGNAQKYKINHLPMLKKL